MYVSNGANKGHISAPTYIYATVCWTSHDRTYQPVIDFLALRSCGSQKTASPRRLISCSERRRRTLLSFYLLRFRGKLWKFHCFGRDFLWTDGVGKTAGRGLTYNVPRSLNGVHNIGVGQSCRLRSCCLSDPWINSSRNSWGAYDFDKEHVK